MNKWPSTVPTAKSGETEHVDGANCVGLGGLCFQEWKGETKQFSLTSSSTFSVTPHVALGNHG